MPRVSVLLSTMYGAIAATLTVAICIGLERHQESLEKKLLAGHQKSIAARQEHFELREVRRQIEARDGALRRGRRHHEEYVAALGGRIGTALKDPALPILGMLHELTRACSPPGSVPHVRVERFTEFNL